MGSLNKKNGHLRGVKAFIQKEKDGDFEPVAALGWAIQEDKKNGKYGFTISVDNKDTGGIVSLDITEAALERMLDAVFDLEHPETANYWEQVRNSLGANVSCNIDGCGCITSVPTFSQQT